MDPSQIALKAAPGVLKSLRALYSQEELANALTGDQSRGRRVMVRRDGYQLIAHRAAELFHAELSHEFSASKAQWIDVAEAVSQILGAALPSRRELLNSIRDPEYAMRRCMKNGGDAFLNSYAPDPQTSGMFYAIVTASLSAIEELIGRASWFPRAAAAQTLRDGKQLSGMLSAIQQALGSETSPPQPTWQAFARNMLDYLQTPPEYYPGGLTNTALAADLRVTEIDNWSFRTFDREGLYWDGVLGGNSRELEEAAQEHLITMILGDPGSGKSTLVKSLVARRLELGKLALFARVEDLFQSGTELSLPSHLIIRRVLELMAEYSGQPDIQHLVRELENGLDPAKAPLVVLDGLDEVPSSGRVRTMHAAARLLADGYSVVVTSRITGYTEAWRDTAHLAVVPLSLDASHRLSAEWFRLTDSNEAGKRFELASQELRHRNVLTNPLTLGFVCFIAHYGSVPVTESAIYGRFVDHFLRRRWQASSQWITDAAVIARLERSATEVAWRMSSWPLQVDMHVWRDTVQLLKLEEVCSSVDIAYDTFKSGLLVPYGHLEGSDFDRFQTVRWLHRALHEHFVGRRLSQIISGREDGWRDVVMRAILNDGWWNALRQTCQLLGDSPAIHILARELVKEMSRGDTPNGQVQQALILVATHCRCSERDAVLSYLAGEGEWADVVRLDPLAGGTALLDMVVRSEDFELRADVARSLVWEKSPHALKILETLNARGALGKTGQSLELLWTERVRSDPRYWWPRALLETDGRGGTIVNTYLLDLEDQTVVEALVEGLVANVCHEPESSICATAIARMECPIVHALSTRTADNRLLALSVAWHFQEEHGVDAEAEVRRLLQGPQHPRDIMNMWTARNLESTFAGTSSTAADLLGFARAAHIFENFNTSEYQFTERFETSDLSLPLAEEIIRTVSPTESISYAGMERLIWALCVLIKEPSVKSFEVLFKWREMSWSSGGIFESLDHASLVAAMNACDWPALLELERDKPNRSEKLYGLLLCVAATVMSWPYSRPIYHGKLEPSVALNMWIDGVEILLREAPKGGGLYIQTEFPHGMSAELAIEGARKVIEVSKPYRNMVAYGARLAAERALGGNGALHQFYEELIRPSNREDRRAFQDLHDLI